MKLYLHTNDMNDRAPIRDRTLVLRILVPGLEARLRDKMKDMEDTAAAAAAASSSSSSTTANNNTTKTDRTNSSSLVVPSGMNNNNTTTTTSTTTATTTKDLYLDLEGVTCEPTTARGGTLWNFHCDGATYPARLVNLPCPVELHKTHDHAAYYKAADIAQMLIVYEDDMALEEDDMATNPPIEGFPSYFHSGLTPPMRKVVERRFSAREHKAVAPPRAAVADVELELIELMEKLSKDEKGKRNKVPTLTSANKVLEEVEEEVVEYEPWMSDFGRQPHGIEFEADDQLCSVHPEVWLSAAEIQKIKEQAEEEKRKKEVALQKKEAKRKEKKQKSTKKGIPAKKNQEEVDEITHAATLSLLQQRDDVGDIMATLGDEDLFGDLDFDDDMNFDGINL